MFPMTFNRKAFLAAASLPVALGVAACGGGDVVAPGETGSPATGTGNIVAISGAGATFPAPLFQRWFDAYNRTVNPDTRVSYQSVGSGAGLEQYINGTVDFAASEAPITTSEDRLKSFKENFEFEPIQVPITGGHVSFSYNLPGVGDRELTLTREAYCGIVTGEITRWNDPILTAANPDVDLPDLAVTFAHRADGSGTTFIFTNHVQTVCPSWTAGAGTSVDWPVGVGGQGNEGVAASIIQNEGTIGYLSYGFAALEEIPSAILENQSGNFIEPTPEAASIALLDEEMPEDFALLVPDPSGPDSYPIVGVVWVMLYQNYENAETWDSLRSVLEWAMGPDGDALTNELLYVPLPAPIVDKVKAVFDTINAG